MVIKPAENVVQVDLVNVVLLEEVVPHIFFGELLKLDYFELGVCFLSLVWNSLSDHYYVVAGPILDELVDFLEIIHRKRIVSFNYP